MPPKPKPPRVPHTELKFRTMQGKHVALCPLPGCKETRKHADKATAGQLMGTHVWLSHGDNFYLRGY
jgi:hypothetical protein